MTTINMRIFRTVLVFVIAIIMVQGHLISKPEVQKEKNSPESKISAVEEEIPTITEPSDAKPKPEVSSSDLKPEISSPVLKPESEPAASTTMKPQNLCSSVNRDCESKPENHLEQNRVDYDQRQNGSENYRIHVDGLVLVLAPMEALLLAGGLGSEMNGHLNMTSALDQIIVKPDKEESISKPEIEKPSQSSHRPHWLLTAPKRAERPVSIKLINLIAPLLEQRH